MTTKKPCNKSTVGIGLRTQHLEAVLHGPNPPPWIELLADNWLADGGLIKHHLGQLANRFPIAVHGVGLSLFGQTPIDFAYLDKIKHLLETTSAISYSEHLSFSRTNDGFIPDLVPISYNPQSLKHAVERVDQVQNWLGRSMLIENVSSYMAYEQDEMTEACFLKQLSAQAGCGILLDINNLYVNQINLNRNAEQALKTLAASDVQQYHLGGHEEKAGYLLDAHNNPVSEPVWSLFESALKTLGARPTLIEWDHQLPTFERLCQERESAQTRIDTFLTHASLTRADTKPAHQSITAT